MENVSRVQRASSLATVKPTALRPRVTLTVDATIVARASVRACARVRTGGSVATVGSLIALVRLLMPPMFALDVDSASNRTSVGASMVLEVSIVKHKKKKKKLTRDDGSLTYAVALFFPSFSSQSYE